jgi:hypothetical protein
MRKVVSALAIPTGLVLLAGPALANDPTSPPRPAGGLTVSRSTVSPGDRIEVQGDGAAAGATVTIILSRSSASLGRGPILAAGPTLARLAASSPASAQRSVALGRTEADAGGRFRATVAIPTRADPGISTVAAASGGEVLGVIALWLVGAGGVGLPVPGASAVLPGLALGVGLIVAGGLLLLRIRFRRRSTV